MKKQRIFLLGVITLVSFGLSKPVSAKDIDVDGKSKVILQFEADKTTPSTSDSQSSSPSTSTSDSQSSDDKPKILPQTDEMIQSIIYVLLGIFLILAVFGTRIMRKIKNTHRKQE